MTLARDLLDRFDELTRRRHPFERHWRDVDAAVGTLNRNDVVEAGVANNEYTRALSQRRREKARSRYDTTMMGAADRLTNGLLSLVFPDAQKWHGLTTATMGDLEDEEEKRWAESLRDLMFFNRYASRAGFSPAIRKVIGSMVRYGPGCLYVEQSFSQQSAMRYVHIPTDEAYFARDDSGNVDTFAQRRVWKARQAVQKGWDVSERVLASANDPKRSGDEFEFIKIVLPRDEPGIRGIETMRNAPWACYTIERAQQRIVAEEGFETFPVSVFSWDDMGDYGTSPCIDYLLEHRMLSNMQKDVLIALNQIVRPAIAVHDNSLMNRPNLNPGAINPGMVSADGRLLMQPVLQGQNPERAAPFIQQKMDQLQEGFYTRLFQILEDQRGSQTATEVLVRNQEKGNMLGPIGARMHTSADVMVERELETLEARGLYAENSPFLPPDSLADKNITPQYTNPMQKLAMAGEAEGVMRMMEIDGIRVQTGRAPLLRDAETGQFLAEAFGAPLKLIKTSEELTGEQEAMNEQANEAQAVDSVSKMAKASSDALPAMEAAGLVQSE